MFIITRRFKTLGSIEEAARRADAGLVPLLKEAIGFKGYHIVQGEGATAFSVTMLETREDAERVKDRALTWIKANLSDLYQGEPDVTSGEVIYSARPDPTAAQAAAQAAELRPH